LKEREQTGRGQKVQSALFENNIFLIAQHMLQYAVTGVPAEPMPSRISAWGVYDVFTVRDGDQIFLSAVSDKQWEVFCRILNLQDLKADAKYTTNNDRVRERPQLIPILRERLQSYSAAELTELFESNGLPYAPINRPEDLVNDPHLKATGGLTPMTLPNGQVTDTVLFPFTMHGKQPGLRMNPPKLGEHSMELLQSLGYSEEQVQKLLSNT
jgi:crotonobetainyl-CoA:carnitine CoA-transferase CaiB-like acyl-CoA transferase